MVELRMEKELLNDVIEREELKLRGMNQKERIILDNMRDEPMEAGGRLSQGLESIPTIQIPSILKSLNQTLRDEEVEQREVKQPLSKGAKRSKRYYIKKRFNQGKPYIPARIRALGRVKARSLGYKNWEDRVVVLKEDEIAEYEKMIQKLSVILGLVVKTRLGAYLRELKNG